MRLKVLGRKKLTNFHVMFSYSRPLRFQLTKLLLRNADCSVAIFTCAVCATVNIPLYSSSLSVAERESQVRDKSKSAATAAITVVQEPEDGR
jgi:hypothetical protein